MEIKSKPELKTLDKKTVAYVSFVGNFMGDAILFGSLFNTLTSWASPKNLFNKDTVFLSSYQDDPKITPPEKMTLEVCMTIPDDTFVDDSQVKKQVLTGGDYVVVSVELDNPNEYPSAWNVAVDWIEENGRKVDMSRPSYEIYLNDPNTHPDNHHLLDICMAVK